MLGGTREEDVLIGRNLKDAGCPAESMEKFFQLHQEGKTGEQLRLLANQRRLLLESLHENQKKIDCLDFLVFSLKRRRQLKDSGSRKP